LSLGVQGFDPRALAVLERKTDAAQATRAFGLAREMGVPNISIDLIYAVPYQNLDTWLDTLRRAIALGPDHVSTYCLSFEEGTFLRHRRHLGVAVVEHRQAARVHRGDAGAKSRWGGARRPQGRCGVADARAPHRRRHGGPCGLRNRAQTPAAGRIGPPGRRPGRPDAAGARPAQPDRPRCTLNWHSRWESAERNGEQKTGNPARGGARVHDQRRAGRIAGAPEPLLRQP